MRKFFSIVLYVIAGIFSASLISVTFVNRSEMNDIAIITLFVILSLSTFFFLLASLLYPKRNYYKPTYLTLLISIVVMLAGGVNQYFMVKGFKNSDINASMADVFKEIDFSYNLFLGIPISIVLLLLTLYFYIQSKKLSTVSVVDDNEKSSTRKRWSPFFISFTVAFVAVYVLSKLFIAENKNGNLNMYSHLNATTYTKLIQANIDNNESVEGVALLASEGYDNYLDDENEFISYDNAIKGLFYKNKWKGKSAVLSTKMWVGMLNEDNLTQDMFDVFFEQLEELDTSNKDTNTTWGILSKEIPQKYLDYMDKKLMGIASSSVNVPLVELYRKDGTTVEDMNLSRAYLLSEVYIRMSEFCDDASHVICDAEEYAKKASESSSLNPSALFLYAFHTEESTIIVDLLEDVLALTKVSDELLVNSKFAVYNNLGYNIYLSEQEDKYDDALRYLEKAYELNSEAVYSLSVMSGIYRDRKDYKSAYTMMEQEVYTFLHASNEALLDKESNYWVFVKSIINTSYEFKDYNTTTYVCDKYLELREVEYDNCHEYMEEIEKLPDNHNTKPIYSFWKLYVEPETFNAVTEKEVLGTLEYGSVMTYGNSLKYKSTSRKQSNLLGKFTSLYAPHKVPSTLKELIRIEEKLGADSYVISFYLDPDSREEFFNGTFSYENKALNKKVAKHFFPLAHIDGTGAKAALWAKDGNGTNLENAPIVEFGSEGQIDIVAKNLKDFIYMLSFGVEPSDGIYSQYVSDNEENYRRENFEAYRKWLKETMHIDPVKDLEVWGAPKKLEALQEEAQKLYKDKLFQWLYTLIPEHGTVEEGKQKADKFIALVKEKKRLIDLIDENATSEEYRLLARNEQGLSDIDRSLEENVSAYYKQAFELDNNISILSEWAMFLGRFTDKSAIKNDKDKAYLNMKFQEVYVELKNEVKAKEHLSLGLDLYKKSAMQEDDAKKKMRLYARIAEIYKDENQTDSAIGYYNKAIEVKADDVLWLKKYYYVDLAEIYEEQKEYALAVKNYKKRVAIVKKKKDKAVYNYRIADNYKALGDYKQALYHARKSLVQAPNNTVLKEDAMELIADIKRLKNVTNSTIRH